MKTYCVICKTELNIKPFRIKRVKNGITCSKKCFGKRQKEQMKGDNNHQFGLKGKLNASFKEGRTKNAQGYILLLLPEHPLSNGDGYYREHRLVIEKNFKNFPAEYFDLINGQVVLKRSFDVHHINEDVADNRIENLSIFNRGDHTSLHNKLKKIIRDNKGRIIGVVKLGELLENPEMDNQQPSYLKSHKSKVEGSETTRMNSDSNNSLQECRASEKMMI